MRDHACKLMLAIFPKKKINILGSFLPEFAKLALSRKILLNSS